MKKPYLFVFMLIVVFAAEAIVFHYIHINTPSIKPAVNEKRVQIKLSSVKPAPSEPVYRCQERPRPEPQKKNQPKPKPVEKPKPKLKHKPKPKPVVKPPEREITKETQKPVVKKTASRQITNRSLQKPASRPVVSAQNADNDKIDKIKAAYLMVVRKKIERNKYYPRNAKKLRQTGMVEVRFTILKDGSIKSIEVVSACRHSRLNRAAVKTLEKIGSFKPLPNVFDADELTLKVPINYKLKNR